MNVINTKKHKIGTFTSVNTIHLCKTIKNKNISVCIVGYLYKFDFLVITQDFN